MGHLSQAVSTVLPEKTIIYYAPKTDTNYVSIYIIFSLSLAEVVSILQINLLFLSITILFSLSRPYFRYLSLSVDATALYTRPYHFNLGKIVCIGNFTNPSIKNPQNVLT